MPFMQIRTALAIIASQTEQPYFYGDPCPVFVNESVLISEGRKLAFKLTCHFKSRGMTPLSDHFLVMRNVCLHGEAG